MTGHSPGGARTSRTGLARFALRAGVEKKRAREIAKLAQNLAQEELCPLMFGMSEKLLRVVDLDKLALVNER